jgi:hypothetical protein
MSGPSKPGKPVKPPGGWKIKGTYAPHVYQIRAGKTKHGPRNHWREWEYVQYAIAVLYGAHLPKNIDRSELVKRVNDWLTKQNPDYRATGLGEVSRTTILRVLEMMQKPS